MCIRDRDFAKLKAQAEKISFEKISRAASLLNSARAEAKWVKSPRMIYELALIKLARPSLDDSKEALLDRISALEAEVKNGIRVTVEKTAAAEKKEEIKPKPKPKPSAKLFVPIDVSSLTASSPIVAAARKWEAISAAIVKRYPHIAQSVINRKITIDGEGIILIFEKHERMMKGIAATYSGQIQEMLKLGTGRDFVVKTAFREDIEDNIIDYWSISGSDKAEADNAERPAEQTASGDPIDKLIERFPEIVEVTDESEFLDYKPAEESFEQSALDDEDDREEFLADDEKSDMSGE